MEKLDESFGLYLPDYRRSIVSLSNSIFRALGLRKGGPGWLDEAEQVTLFIVDGLSAYLLEGHPKFERLKRLGEYRRISSVFPTTTTTAMASLMTGLTPAKHGLLGYSMLCRECGGLVELIRGLVRLPEHLTPKDILPYPTLFDESWKKGVKARAFLRKHLVESVLTKIFYGEAKVEPFVDLEDLLIRIRKAKDGLVGAYWEVIDTVGHVYGPSSEEMKAHVERLVGALLNFPFKKQGRRVLVLTADHGFVDVAKKEVLIRDKRLMKGLYLPPFGDLRATFLLINEEGIIEYVRERYGRMGAILGRDEVVKLGLLGGRPSKDASARLGDLALLPEKGKWLDIRFKRKYDMKGAHSGLSLEELEVPMLVLKY